MTSKYAVVALALLPTLMLAEDEVTKVIHVRYARAEALKEVLNNGGASVLANNGLKAVVIRGSPSFVAATEQAVKELDVPLPYELARDVELTVYVLGASPQAAPEDRSIADIEPVIRQLKAVFPYGGYQLLDSMMIRSREGRRSLSDGVLKSFSRGQLHPNPYHIRCNLGDRNDGGSDRTIRLDSFSFSTQVPDADVSVDANFDIQNGQKVVVGSTNIDGGNSALFVVVSAKFVQ
ncbi:MAG TPA: secretin N-terminal domain-containing protein [Bryobacteraceae bacterium]|jgi:hypothetical protein|nr:secretin N-terminal domain-containing protein [Bryobacteraceae bacterium]